MVFNYDDLRHGRDDYINITYIRKNLKNVVQGLVINHLPLFVYHFIIYHSSFSTYKYGEKKRLSTYKYGEIA
jgi:hypothetical protein